MTESKVFFWEIKDIESFLKNERKKAKVQEHNKLTNKDLLLLKEVQNLIIYGKKLIRNIQSNNFKETIMKLIQTDAKISSYMFFLINCDHLEEEKIHYLVEKDSLEDYYTSLSYEDSLNTYKLIVM